MGEKTYVWRACRWWEPHLWSAWTEGERFGFTYIKQTRSCLRCRCVQQRTTE